MSLASLAASSGVRSMGVAIRGDDTDLTRMLARSAANVDVWEKKTSGSALRWASSWKLATAGVAAGIVAIVVGLGAAGLAAVGFERDMRNVNSLLLESDAVLSSLSVSVLDISREIPQSAENLAKGLYDIASSGFQGAEGLLVLEASAKAASAGLSNTKTAAGVVTSVLNAYGLSAASATDVSDILFSTVNYGVVSFEELAGSLGDVIGMSSAAQVPIADVGAAIATMTLSGIGAAEASTSLNRTIQALIQPSEALAAVYKQLGYESGLQALQTKGLYGVMEDLRGVTQGNAEAYLRLFPEIRAARGAFALAANEGQVYADIQAKIGDATVRAGSTQAAFSEQMNSTAAKWAQFTNSMKSNTIEVGLQVLPVFNGILDVLTPLADNVVPALTDAWALIAPRMEQVKDIGVDLWEVLQAIYEAAQPIVGALAAIGGAIANAGLDVLLTTLNALTTLMSENKGVVVAVAAAYASRYLPSITQVITSTTNYTQSLRTMIREQIQYQRTLATGSALNGQYVGQVSRLRLMAAAAGTSLRGLALSARAAGAAFIASGAGTAILVAGLSALVYAAATAAQEVEASLGEIQAGASGLNNMSLRHAVNQIEELQAELGEIREAKIEVQAGDFAPAITAVRSLGSAWNEYTDLKKVEAVNEALSAMNEKIGNAARNARALSDETGLAGSELLKLAESQGIDLTVEFNTEQAAAQRDQIKMYLKNLEKQTGVSTQKMGDDWNMSVEQIEVFAKAVQDATKKAQQAFLQASDVLGTWRPNIGVEAEAEAVENLADARARLAELESDASSTANELVSARKRVADAEGRLLEAQAERASGTLEAFYREAITTGQQFSENLDKAVQLGLDPQVVQKLLQQGPEQAGPIVEQMVADTTGALIEMVNQAEATLADINQRVVLQARLTAIAVNATTEDVAKQLPKALDISSRTSSGQSRKDIAAALGLSEESVQEIADNYGINLIRGLDASLKGPYAPDYAETLGLGGTDGMSAGEKYGQGFVTGLMAQLAPLGAASPYVRTASGRPVNAGQYASGGILPGWSPGRDIHRFYSATGGMLDLSGGEGIGRPEFVAALGAGKWNALNLAARTGGVDAVRRMLSTSYLGGFANGTSNLRVQTVAVPVTSTHRTEAPMYVDKMYVQDPGEGRRVARRTRALNQIGGRRAQ